MKIFLIAAVISVFGVSSLEAQECKARVLAHLTDDLGNHWKMGTVLPVDIARGNARVLTFCASGGSCLPSKVDDRKALQLLNCKVGPALGNGDFRLVPSTHLAGEAGADAIQRRRDATEKLNDLGFSNASAGSLADDYVNRPQSRNARLVDRALAGSQAAINTLKRNNP